MLISDVSQISSRSSFIFLCVGLFRNLSAISFCSSTHHVVGVEVFHGADVFAREGTRSGHFGVIPGFGTSFGGNVGHGEGDNARLEHEGNHFENVCRGCFAFGEERLKPMRNVSELNDC